MAAPGTGERLVALPLAWLAGVALQRHERALWPLAAYVAIASAAAVVIVRHCGSKTSSSAPFLDAVRPRIAVFQPCYRNRFGLPAGEVLDRYRERDIAIVASPACGAWQWRADGAADGACEREVARRYWHHRIEPAPH
jgi:competence protein ComEC